PTGRSRSSGCGALALATAPTPARRTRYSLPPGPTTKRTACSARSPRRKCGAPWGLALVEDELWVGNFGDGLINNYDPVSGNFIETLMRADGTPLQFDGLWDLLPQAGGSLFYGWNRRRRTRPLWHHH